MIHHRTAAQEEGKSERNSFISQLLYDSEDFLLTVYVSLFLLSSGCKFVFIKFPF